MINCFFYIQVWVFNKVIPVNNIYVPIINIFF